MDSKVASAVKELIKAIQESEEYITFENHRKQALSNDELLRNIKRTRVIREQLGKMSEYDRNSASAEALENEYDNLCDITAVHKFSLAELEVCEMYREVMAQIVNNVNIDL